MCVCVCVRARVQMHVREHITTHYGEEGTPLKINMPTDQFMLLNQAIQHDPEHSIPRKEPIKGAPSRQTVTI